jgi:hypothetical protein
MEASLVTPLLPNDPDRPAHPWRRCPLGKHFVREHKVHIPPSKKHPNGLISIRHEHCASNRSKKDELSFDEIQHISNTYFSSLVGPPTASVSAFIKQFPNADNYDHEIRGWVRYWNDIFKLDDPLDPNLVKALIATESSFAPDPKGNKIARGLMQVRNTTRNYLSDTKGELNNYLVVLTNEELLNSSANICAGVRWLFRKKETASGKLKYKATWFNAIEDYKSYLDKILNKENYNHKPMADIDKFYKLLQENNNENKNSASSHLIIDSVI